MLLKLLTYIFMLCFATQIGISQTLNYEHFGVDDGLPSSEVYDVYQDKLGYIWFATDKGLSRYNGYEFENFTTKDGLPDNTIFDFYPQQNGQVWCYSYHTQSLFYFNEIFDGFNTYEHNDTVRKNIGSKGIIKSVVLDNNNTLLLGGYSIEGIIEISNDGRLKRFYDKESTEYSDINLGVLTDKKIFFSAYDDYKSQGNTFIFSPKQSPTSRLKFAFINDDDYVFIDRKLGKVSKKGDVTYYNTELNPIGIRRIDNNSFFVGYYSNGAEIRTLSGDIIDTFLPKKSVTRFLIDKEGSYWFTTLDDGVYYIKNPSIKVTTQEHISSLVKDNNNNLYAGYKNGDIRRILKDKTEILYKGIHTDAAIVEFNKQNKTLYSYSDYNLNNYTNKNESFFLTVNKIPEHIGESLLGSGTHFFYQIENNNFKMIEGFNYKIQDICNYNGDTFIATSSGLFIHKNDSIKPHQPIDILTNRIDDIDLNKNTNTLYMATQGAGVIVYGDSIYNITENHGLTNSIVSEVHIENDSTIWACTNSGLNRIVFKNDSTFQVSTITKAEGLLSNDIDDIEIINDTIWVATKKGLCYFNKDILTEKEDLKILSLILKTVMVNKQNITIKNPKLKHYENSIDFNLQAITHKNTEKINYLYRLKEIDTTWTSTTSRAISFSSLTPGNYTFQAKANVLNKPNKLSVSYNFTIQPPFYKRWWFYSLCALVIAGLIYIFFKVRVLTYNQDVFRELIRLAIKRLKRKEQLYKFRSNGEDFKIPTRDILYINSQGNYLDIVTNKKTYTIRCKIGDFINTTPDSLEYLRVHRSYIIRIDQVSSKGKNWVVIKDHKIPVGETFLKVLDNIQF